MTVEIRVLGEVAVLIDGRPVDVGPARQRCVLVALAASLGRATSIDRLADHVWGERPPQRAHGTLRTYLSRLRQALAPAGAVDIVRRRDGYVLAVDPAAVDLYRFRDLVAAARSARDDAGAAELYGRALGRWRGEAFAVLDTPWLNAMRESLAAERLAAVLDRNDVALRLGRHADLVSELSAAAAAYPWDERLARQLMLSLYRCGRQSEALELFEHLRLRLADELGADPCPPLRQLHRQILRADPILATPTAEAAGRTSAAPSRDGSALVPRQLPASVATFVGRLAERTELDKIMDAGAVGPATVAIAAIGGTGGIGKTWLALRWANDHVDRFPDGQLYVNLRGFDPTAEPVTVAEAVRGFLTALGVDEAQLPSTEDAQAALYRSLIAGRRMLILLDNARNTETVVPLLPGTASCAVLVTSRRHLAGLVVAHGAHPLTLDGLTEVEAYEALACRLGHERLECDRPAVVAVVKYCGGLPLALGIIAARAARQPDLPLSRLAAGLQTATTRLDSLDAGEPAVNLRAVLSCSTGALTPDASRALALLGLAGRPDISVAAVASLIAGTAPEARRLLRHLAEAHLVHEHAPGRYRMHDLVRLFAAELTAHDSPVDSEALPRSRGRGVAHYRRAPAQAGAPQTSASHRSVIELSSR